MKIWLYNYMNLDNLKESFIVDCFLKSKTLKELSELLKIGLAHKRDKDYFMNEYGIDLMKFINNNKKIYNIIEKNEIMNKIVRCDFCNEFYKNGDRIRKNKSNHHFCSDLCSKKFSSMFSNTEKCRKIKSEKSKRKFGFKFIDGKFINIKEEYEKNPKKCGYCEKPIPYSRRFMATCCNEHGKLLSIKKYKISSKKYHRTGGKRYGAGRGKHGWYNGFYCDSSWELAWVIFNIDHKIKFKRNDSIFFEYYYNGHKHKYYPDFIMSDGSFVEIKGYNSKQWQQKLKSIPKNILIKVLYFDEMKFYIDYAIKKYGNEYTNLYNKDI